MRINIIAFVACGCVAAPAFGQLSAQDIASYRLIPQLSDRVPAAVIVQDPTQPNVQFIAGLGGRIRILRDFRLLPADFLDLSTQTYEVTSLAFAPDYATSGRFYVAFLNEQGDPVVARFERSADSNLAADPATRFDLIWPGGESFIRRPWVTNVSSPDDFPDHLDNDLQFGPDGYLYVGIGDGGDAGDPYHFAQDPTSIYGKMLRLDVSVAATDPEGYDVPADNPFVGQAGVLPEIWAFGLRNPLRYSFDSAERGGTGGLIIADAGVAGPGGMQEINVEPQGARGRNYGWRNRSGAHDNNQSIAAAFQPLTDPTYEFAGGTTDPSTCDGAIKEIVGGMIYRGFALGADYVGRYFFASGGTGIYSMKTTVDPHTGAMTFSDLRNHTLEIGDSRANRASVPADRRCAPLGHIRSFGVDAAGELYVASNEGVYRVRLGGCAGVNPFDGMSNMWGVCIDGAWLPSTHPLALPWTGAPVVAECATVRPGLDWFCVHGGWVPPGHPLSPPNHPRVEVIPVVQAASAPVPVEESPVVSATAVATACGGPDPFESIPGMRGVCINGGWVPSNHPLAAQN